MASFHGDPPGEVAFVEISRLDEPVEVPWVEELPWSSSGRESSMEATPPGAAAGGRWGGFRGIVFLVPTTFRLVGTRFQ